MISVVEILKVLNEGKNFIHSIPNYKTIGAKVVDNFNMFDKYDEIIPTSFKLIPHTSRMNLSVQMINYGTVKINPLQAKRNDLDKEIDQVVKYNNKTIIQDGELNTEKILVIVDKITLLKLKSLKLDFKVLDKKSNGTLIEIDFKGMPIFNNTNIDFEEILKNNVELVNLTAKQQVLKYLQEKVNPLDGIFNENQQNLINDHGLNNKLEYIGIDNEEIVSEEYKAKVINFKIKNSSSSSMNKIFEKINADKKLNKMEQYKINYYKEMKDYSQDYINNELNNIKNQITNIKIKNCIDKINIKDSIEDVKYKELTISVKMETFKR